ncbi:hypothetical protein DFJ43DRAFT_1204285 [Lentinula guzmanii]|uniref:Uncharacterized protein n=1 Tax=Lentinula guzmanii TaxID=2804957 RepID=A0AA38JFN3_9AGAR|nr:hypothetical protein DFJ43DRAFT_1204285 [Lentinula guzmanii]
MSFEWDRFVHLFLIRLCLLLLPLYSVFSLETPEYSFLFRRTRRRAIDIEIVLVKIPIESQIQMEKKIEALSIQMLNPAELNTQNMSRRFKPPVSLPTSAANQAGAAYSRWLQYPSAPNPERPKPKVSVVGDVPDSELLFVFSLLSMKTPTPHPQTEPSSPQTADTDHSGQADTLVAGSSTAATPVTRFDDSTTLAAVQRLEALMKTGSYHCYFPGPITTMPRRALEITLSKNSDGSFNNSDVIVFLNLTLPPFPRQQSPPRIPPKNPRTPSKMSSGSSLTSQNRSPIVVSDSDDEPDVVEIEESFEQGLKTENTRTAVQDGLPFDLALSIRRVIGLAKDKDNVKTEDLKGNVAAVELWVVESQTQGRS